MAGFLDGMSLVVVVVIIQLIFTPAQGKDLPKKCTSDAENKTVSCSFADLHHFPDQLPPQIESLDLSRNKLQTLPQTIPNYPHLKRLIVSAIHLRVLSESTFDNLPQLTYLDLSQNNIESLEDINSLTLFTNNPVLKVLNISMNRFNRLDYKTRFVSQSLEVLDISGCRIHDLDYFLLYDLPSLTHLNVSKNPIKWMSTEHPLHSLSLTHLDMSGCQLDSLRRNSLEEMPNLQVLILSRNPQLHLNTINVTSKSVYRFEAEFCQFKRPGLHEFENLTIANLRGNKIETITAKTFGNNAKVRILDLSENNIKNVERDGFFGLHEIESLNLASNEISYLFWDMFITNHQLKHLNLSYNPIIIFPSNMTVNRLQTLTLHHCEIAHFDGEGLSRLPYLTNLDISHNLIENIFNNIQSHSLKTLDISYGRLSSLNNETFASLPSLECLNLKGNRFTSTPKDYMFASNPRLQKIRLSDNPWICDCEDKDFQNFWKYINNPLKIDEEARFSLKCMSPPKHSDRRWEDACYNEFNPMDPMSSLLDSNGVYMLVIAMTACLALVATVSIRYRMKKRRKTMRTREEAQRRQSRDAQERMVRQFREDSEPTEQQTIVLSEPPSYEEAIFMSRSVEELLRASHLPTIHEEDPPTPGGPNERDSEINDVEDVVPKDPDDSGEDHDYDEVPEEQPETPDAVVPQQDVAVSVDSSQTQPEEEGLLQELRIEIWSRDQPD